MPSARSDARRRKALDALRALHDEIDREAGRLADEHASRLQCKRGCSTCCLDDLTVASVEAERIREGRGDWLQTATPHAPGACAFLDTAGACRVYTDRPSVCRTQGLPLRVLFEDADEEVVEHRDICPLNEEGGPPLDSLDESSCWLVGPSEFRLARIEADFVGDEDIDAHRVSLRSLFAKSTRV